MAPAQENFPSRAEPPAGGGPGAFSGAGPASASPARAGAERRRVWLLGLLLAAVALLVYLPVRHHAFVSYDDADYVTDNPRVRAGLTWAGVKWAFTTGHASNWHPLTWLSHQLDVSLFGPGAGGPHLVNVFLHLVNTVLLFAWLRRCTGAVGRSAFVAALFALHPLHVESVAWVAERKDVLSGFFFFLTLLAYANHARSRAAAGTGFGASAKEAKAKDAKPARWYAAALALFALGLMCKPMLVTLPCVLLLLDVWPLQRLGPRGASARDAAGTLTLAALWREKIPFFALSAASSVATFVAQDHGGAVRSLTSFPLGERLGNAVVSYARYLGKIVWPADLAAFYPHPGHWPWGLVALAALLVVGLSVGALMLARKAPFAVTGWFWFLGMLVPTVGLVQVGNQAMADRYTYLPAIGVYLLIAWGVGSCLLRWRVPRAVVGIGALAALAACAALTRGQLRHWETSERLFARALAVTERNYVAHHGLGYALLARGRADEAIAAFRRAIEIQPRFAEAHCNLGSAWVRKGRDDEAIASFEKAREILPGFALAHYNLGTLWLQQGRVDQAVAALRRAVELRADDAVAQVNLGNALLQKGEPDQAAARYAAALAIQPDYADAQNNLGHISLQRGRVDDAIARFRAAVKLQPTHANAYYNLGDAHLRRGELDEAAAAFRASVAINPADAEAQSLLGAIFLQQGRWEEALAPTLLALKRQPDFAPARENLGRLLQAAQTRGDTGMIEIVSAQIRNFPAASADRAGAAP